MSYSCDRERSITFGIEGGLPGYPHGTRLNPGKPGEKFLGAIFSGYPVFEGDEFDRPSSGGGGFGDPLKRDPAKVLEDVIDDYVSVERARKDYGVVINAIDPENLRFELDTEATEKERAMIRANRKAWLAEDPESVAARYRAGDLDLLDTIRRYGVIVDQRNGQLLPKTTAQFRESFQQRAASHWG
jgi:N-methylhydantoinase B